MHTSSTSTALSFGSRCDAASQQRLRLVSRATQAPARNPGAWSHRSLSQGHKGDAREAFLEATRLDPLFWGAWHELASGCVDVGDLKKVRQRHDDDLSSACVVQAGAPFIPRTHVSHRRWTMALPTTGCGIILFPSSRLSCTRTRCARRCSAHPPFWPLEGASHKYRRLTTVASLFPTQESVTLCQSIIETYPKSNDVLANLAIAFYHLRGIPARGAPSRLSARPAAFQRPCLALCGQTLTRPRSSFVTFASATPTAWTTWTPFPTSFSSTACAPSSATTRTAPALLTSTGRRRAARLVGALRRAPSRHVRRSVRGLFIGKDNPALVTRELLQPSRTAPQSRAVFSARPQAEPAVRTDAQHGLPLLLQSVSGRARLTSLSSPRRSYLAAWTLVGHEYLELKNIAGAIAAYRRAIGTTLDAALLGPSFHLFLSFLASVRFVSSPPMSAALFFSSLNQRVSSVFFQSYPAPPTPTLTLSPSPRPPQKSTPVITGRGMAWARPTRSKTCSPTRCTRSAMLSGCSMSRAAGGVDGCARVPRLTPCSARQAL